MKAFVPLFFYLVAAVTMIGCSTMDPETNLLGGGRVTIASANQIFDPGFEGFTDEQLLRLLDPENKAKLTGRYSDLSESDKIEYLRKAFREANQETTYGIAHRSQIQDRLVAASNQRCNLYTTYLKRVSTFTNGIFGTLSTILGGAGAIVTGENAARALSGLAGISSGTRAELNQAIFESVASSVIVPGIQQRRAEVLKELMEKRSKTLEQYTVEGAIADAITYHGACSLDAGIAYAQKSIQAFDDIGVKRLVSIQNQVSSARTILASATSPLGEVIVSQKILDDFGKKMAEYQAKVDPAKPEQKPVFDMAKNLVDASGKDGALRAEATHLDEVLKAKMVDYVAATTDAERSASLALLEKQQGEARNFARTLEAKQTEILIEFKKLSK